MKRHYVAPDVTTFGSIHQITGFTALSQQADFAWGPNGEVISNADDHGSVNYCRQSSGVLVPCDTRPGTAL